MEPQTSTTLQEIIDHHEIRKVLSVYCHGCDRRDEARMSSVYLEDSWDDHGDYKGSGRGLVQRVMNNTGPHRTVTHLLGQSIIQVSGDEAGAETYFFAVIADKDEQSRAVLTHLGGRFVDNFLRVRGEWKIKKRICVRDWSISLDVEKDNLANNNLVQGQLSGRDPSYAALGLNHPGISMKT
jgi:hypothetical protein